MSGLLERVVHNVFRRDPDGDLECGRRDLVLVGSTWTVHRCTRLRHWSGWHLLEPVTSCVEAT